MNTETTLRDDTKVVAPTRSNVDGPLPLALMMLTAVAMGLRNATVGRLALPDMTTTVQTLTLTGFAAESSLAGGTNPRIGRRAASVLLMFAGAAMGALLLQFSLPLPLVLGGALVLVAAAVFATVRSPTPSIGGRGRGEHN